MGRILFFIGLGIVLYALVRTALSGFIENKKRPRKRVRTGNRSAKKKLIRLCECPVCKTHFAEEEAVLGDDVKYCSEACRAKARHEHEA